MLALRSPRRNNDSSQVPTLPAVHFGERHGLVRRQPDRPPGLPKTSGSEPRRARSALQVLLFPRRCRVRHVREASAKLIKESHQFSSTAYDRPRRKRPSRHSGRPCVARPRLSRARRIPPSPASAHPTQRFGPRAMACALTPCPWRQWASAPSRSCRTSHASLSRRSG